MSLNNKEIDLILHELKLEGYFIQKIIQPSYTSLVFYLYNKNPLTLFISLEAQACRLHSTSTKIPKFDKPIRFMELLRSRIKGAQIKKVEHINNDRIIRLDIKSAEITYFLYIRLWSGAANIILTDENNIIIDAFYRRPKKREASGCLWTIPSPPPLGKKTQSYSVREYNTEMSFNEAIEKLYLYDETKGLKENLIREGERIYGGKIQRLEQALERLKIKREQFLNAVALKNAADLLFANLYKIKKGLTFIELEDFTKDNSLVTITLDPLKTPQENASLYYEKYKKAVSGLAALEDDITSAEKELNLLKEKIEKIRNEENPYQLQKLIQKEKIPTQEKIKNTKHIPGLKFNCSGWTILVGRTASENDELLRKFVKGADLWLHTRDYPGGYVFIKSRSGKTIPLPILLKAGNLAVFYSKARQNQQADLYTTQVKYLRRAKNAPKGTVLPTHEKNLLIRIDEKLLKELEKEKITSYGS